MRSPIAPAVALLAISQGASAFKVSLIADHNHDGKADCKDLKVEGRCSSDVAEAFFLPAITDTDRRCSKKITNETDAEDFEKCHDGTDSVLRHPERLAPVITKPVKGLSDEATGTIGVVCDTEEYKTCKEKVRIFQDVEGEWTYLNTANHTFSAKELKTGLKLGIDGRDIRRPNIWDGRVQLNFHVKDGKTGKDAADCVSMRVSPLLTHHHLQDAEKVFSFGDAQGYAPFEQFKKDLAESVAAAGFEEPINYFDKYPDLWIQDFFEAAYTSIPGPHGEAISIRVMIRSSVPWNDAGRAVFEELRNGDVGAVQDFQSQAENPNIDATGNLETIPPYGSGGSSYPNGRIVMGMFEDDKPAILDLLGSQEQQDPVVLDNNWLEVGHVDEYFQFVPTDGTDRGWVLMAADPSLGLGLLKEAEKAGKGDVRAHSRYPKPYDDAVECMPNHTISEVLNMTKMEEANEFAYERIEYNIGILKKETGLTDKEIIRIPSVYYMEGWRCDGAGTSIEDDPDEGGEDEEEEEVEEDNNANNRPVKRWPRPAQRVKRDKRTLQEAMKRASDPDTSPRPPGMEWGLSSFYSATINGLVLPGQIVTANPWGPVIEGVDIFAKLVEKAYGSVGLNVTFVDDWSALRLGQGGVHCASNTWRDVGEAKWW